MIDFSDYEKLKDARSVAIEVDRDRRQIMKECNTFVTKRDGQWEPNVWKLFGDYNRPRYTLDMTRPIVDSIYGELTQNQFNIVVKPMGAGSSKEVAKVYAGLIKNMENLSNASAVYNTVAKKAIVTGAAAFRIDQEWCDSDAFDRELLITPIHDALDRVWFLGNYQKQTGEDSDAVTVDHLVSAEEYAERFGNEREAQSLGDTDCHSVYYYARTGIRISELIYKKKVKRVLYRFDGGTVLSEEDAKKSGADLSKAERRERDTYKIMVRFYDGKGYISEPEDTVFEHLNVIPVWPNFEIVEDKPITNGVVEWLMDWQRIRNYGGSKKVEDVALAPKARLMMTPKQAAGHEKQLKTMNTSSRSYDFYNPDPEAVTPPYWAQPAMESQGANELLAQSETGISASSGVYPAQVGNNPALQSGVAIDKIQNKGDIGKLEYFNAMQVALSHAGRVSIKALKNLHDTQKELRIINEDGSYEMAMINEVGLDGEKVNDLSKGVYDVVCDIGPAFRNRQEKTAEQIIALGSVDPTIIMQGKDVLLNSIDSPGMDTLAERARAELLKAGVIPESQWTDEEKAAAQAAAQASANTPPPPDPMMIAAQAELEKAQAANTKNELEAIKLQQNQQKLDFDQMMQQNKGMVDSQVSLVNMLNTMADTLNKIGSSVGIGGTLSPNAAQAYDKQAQNIEIIQEQM